MPTKVLVPLLGEGVEEVTIVNWLKAEGDSVDEFEGLLEVETDKVVTEIPAPAAGTVLKIFSPNEGDEVSVGDLLAWIGEPGESIPDVDSSPKVKEQTPVEAGEATPEVAAPLKVKTIPQTSPAVPLKMGRDPNLGFISPVVAKIAAEKGIDLSKVKGTGLNGRITKNDVLAFTPETVSPSPQISNEPGTIIPHTNMRRRIAEHMVKSKQTSPHVTTVMEVDVSRIMAHRKANKETFAQNGVRLTFTAYFVAAAVEALKTYPVVNSSWNDDGILLHPQINIGMATDLGDDGLIVPIIKNAENLSLLGIAKTVNDLAARARSNKLAPDDVQGGTFTITNHGVSGSLFASPIINQPQCAILGVGAIQKRVVVLTDDLGNDTIAIRPMMYLSLTFDHRILDGAIADHFLSKIISVLGEREL